MPAPADRTRHSAAQRAAWDRLWRLLLRPLPDEMRDCPMSTPTPEAADQTPALFDPAGRQPGGGHGQVYKQDPSPSSQQNGEAKDLSALPYDKPSATIQPQPRPCHRRP